MLRVSENGVLRRIFGLKVEVVIEGLKILHNEELHGLYFSPYTIMVIRWKWMQWLEHVAHMKEMRNAYNFLVRKAEGKRYHLKT
jgi:hypothetical protein